MFHVEHWPIEKLTTFAGPTGNDVESSRINHRYREMASHWRQAAHFLTVYPQAGFLVDQVSRYANPVSFFLRLLGCIIRRGIFWNLTKNCQLIRTMADYCFMTIYSKRSPEPEIANGLEYAALAAAILAIDEVHWWRKNQFSGGKVSKVLGLESDERHAGIKSGMEWVRMDSLQVSRCWGQGCIRYSSRGACCRAASSAFCHQEKRSPIGSHFLTLLSQTRPHF